MKAERAINKMIAQLMSNKSLDICPDQRFPQLVLELSYSLCPVPATAFMSISHMSPFLADLLGDMVTNEQDIIAVFNISLVTAARPSRTPNTGAAMK